MDDPVGEITGVIQTLCTAPPSYQQKAVEKYFTRNASFTHPFCRTGSFNNSRWYIAQIYLWYKILSPKIDVHIDSIAFDKANLLLYVSIHQTFKIWAVPFYKAQPSLTTVLKLTHDDDQVSMAKTYADAVRTPTDDSDGQPESSKGSKEVAFKQRGSADHGKKYYIQSQNDLYQTNEFIKFVVPWGIGATFTMLFQLWATFLCVIGAFLGRPISWLAEDGMLASVKKK